MAISNEDEALLSLARYMLAANLMRERFGEAWEAEKRRIATNTPRDTPWDEGAYRLYLDLWLGMLYVVYEGYSKLKCQDAAVDALQNATLRKTLKNYRHGTFHYQPDWFSEKHTDFMDLEVEPWGTALAWANKLHLALWAFAKGHWSSVKKTDRAELCG